MLTLTEFLLARIAEDEAIARGATPGPWRWEEESIEAWPMADQSLLSDGVPLDEWGGSATVLRGWGYDASGIEATDADRAHIARFNPARVLAESEAKRRIVELHPLNPYWGLDRYGRWLPREGEPKAWYCDCQAEDGMIQGEAPCPTLRILALLYDDHPDYREEWRL